MQARLLDLLNAQQRLFEAKRDRAETRYGYLLAYLRLRRAAGIVGFEDLHDIAGYFIRVGNSPAPINTARAKKQESLQQLE